MSSLAKDTKGPTHESGNTAEVTQRAALPLLGQFLQHSLQLLTYKLHETVLDVTVRNIDHEDEGGRVGRLILLQESRQSTEIIIKHIYFIIKLKHSETLEGHQMSHLIFRTEHGMKSLSRPQSLMLQNDKGCFPPGV